jgi:hypothetical protein
MSAKLNPPVPPHHDAEDMSLRDRFAWEIFMGGLADLARAADQGRAIKALAVRSYLVADAMMAARGNIDQVPA